MMKTDGTGELGNVFPYSLQKYRFHYIPEEKNIILIYIIYIGTTLRAVLL